MRAAQAHMTQLENVRPWALQQWSQKSLWSQLPSASLHMSPSGNELVPGQLQPSEAPAVDATQAFVGGGHYEAHPPPPPSYPIDVLTGASDASSPENVDDGYAGGSNGPGGRSLRAAGGGSLRTLIISGSVRATPQPPSLSPSLFSPRRALRPRVHAHASPRVRLLTTGQHARASPRVGTARLRSPHRA